MASLQNDFFDFLGLFAQPPDWPSLPSLEPCGHLSGATDLALRTPIMAQMFFICVHNRALWATFQGPTDLPCAHSGFARPYIFPNKW